MNQRRGNVPEDPMAEVVAGAYKEKNKEIKVKSRHPSTSSTSRLQRVKTTTTETGKDFLKLLTELGVGDQPTETSWIPPVNSLIGWNPDKSESIVMDKELLLKVIHQTLKDRVSSITNEEEISFNEVLKLYLDYQGIQTIDHLWDFTSLTKLYLNNNLIERIQGLDHLINLTWLNLSFNKIGKIEGLESLQKLEMLNLSSNSICVIENIDKLEKLTHLCIANNLIEQLDNVLYLRRFKNLFNLSLSGNPGSKVDDYELLIAAYLPNLTSLDYRIIHENMKNEASIKYSFVLEQIRHRELQEQQAVEDEQNSRDELQLHLDAFVESLNGSYLFKSMFEGDPEAETLQCVPEVAQLLVTYENQMVELCMQLFELGLADHKQREIEVNSLRSVQERTVTDYQQKALHILASFEQQHKERINKLKQLSDLDIQQQQIDHCNNELQQLCKSLMSLEFQLVSQVEDIVKRLEDSISDMVSNFSQAAQEIFVQCRDLEDNYYQNVQKVATATLEKVARDSKEEELSEDVTILFTDRETVMDALATGHDNHLLKINERETLLFARLNAWKVALINEIKDKDLKGNRMRILDIYRYVDYLKEQLKEWE